MLLLMIAADQTASVTNSKLDGLYSTAAPVLQMNCYELQEPCALKNKLAAFDRDAFIAVHRATCT